MAYPPVTSAFEQYREALEQFELQMGTSRGRLAVALDILTEAVILIGQHAVYCRSTRYPDEATHDVRLVMRQIEQAKELVSSVMEEIRRNRQSEAKS